MRALHRLLPATVVALALIASACGDAGDPPDGSGDTPTDAPADDPADDPDGESDDATVPSADGLAPACEDLEPEIEVEGDLADDPEVADAQRERARYGLPSDEDVTRRLMEEIDPADWVFPFPHTLEEQDELESRGGVAEEFSGPVREWALSEAPDEFAGLWVDQAAAGVMVVAFTDDAEGYADEIHDRFAPDIEVVEVENPYLTLEQVLEDVSQQELGQDTADGDGASAPGTVVSAGLQETINRVTIGIVGGDDAAMQEISDTHGADRICFEVHEEPDDGTQPDDRVTTLARVDGWRNDLETSGFYEQLEVAADEETAQRAWDDNVPSDLPDIDGDPDRPVDPGAYGSFDDLDLDTHALVVWSAGESGTCPEWVDAIETSDDAVEVTLGSTAGPGEACTDDFNPYRLVLAVDRELLPDLADLPMPLAGGESIQLDREAVPYPEP